MLEHLAAPIEKDSEAIPSRTHSALKWSQICHCSVRRFNSFAIRTNELQLIEVQTTLNRIQIDCRKLLKYRDEYSKKSRQTPEQMESRLEGNKNRVRTDPEPESIFKGPTAAEETRKRKLTDLIATQLAPTENPLTVEELDTAWEMHHKPRGEQTRVLVFQRIVGMNGNFDLERFRQRHTVYCEYWDRKDWKFCPLSFLDWIEQGMPLPPPEPTAKQAKRKDDGLDDFFKEAHE